MSFKGIKIFYCNTEDGQIASNHFIALTVKNVILIVQEKHVCHGIIRHFHSL